MFEGVTLVQTGFYPRNLSYCQRPAEGLLAAYLAARNVAG